MSSSSPALAALLVGPEKQCELEQTQPRAATPQQQQPLPQQEQPQYPLLAALIESPPSSPELLPKRGARKGRQCDACHTTETPMWRRGGKGTLCNACGVRWSLRKKRPPRPGLEGEAGEALSPLPDSDDPAFGSMLDDEATDPAIAALRSKRESDKQDYYYCRYCDKTWPLNYFRNSQQFGAHCSNCSRKKRPSPNGETEAVVAKPKRERRDRKRVKREPIPAAAPYWSEGDASASPTASPASSRTSSAFTSSPPTSTSTMMPTSPSSSASRKRERDHSSAEGAMTKRRSKHHNNGNGALSKSARRDHHHRHRHQTTIRSGSSGSGSSGGSSGGDSEGEEDDEGDDDEGAWERLFEKLKGNSARQVVAAAPAAVSRVLSEEERRREVELLEKEVTLLRYQVRLKEHWHKKSLKEVKHNMEEELHELQKDLIYSFEVAQACIKLELESNEKEETQVLLAFARHISLPPTPQPHSPQQQPQPQPRDGGSASEAGSTSSSGACTPCHDNLDKLRQDGEQLRRSCAQQLAKLKTELEQQFNAKEEIFMHMLGETKTHFSASTLRLRKKIAEIESIIGTLRTPAAASEVASPSSPSVASKIAPPALSAATCQ